MQLALDCFLFLFTHIIERLQTMSLLGRYWKNFKELREHMGSFKSSLDWAFCQGIDQSPVTKPRFRVFLFERVSCERTDWPRCFTQRMLMDCFWGHLHQDVFLDSSSTQQQRAPRSLTVPRMMYHRSVFSTKISDPHFLPKCILFTQFSIYTKHCWGHFLLLSLNTQGSSLIPAL